MTVIPGVPPQRELMPDGRKGKAEGTAGRIFGKAGADEGISAGGVGRKDCKVGIGEEQADKGMEQ